MSYACEYGLFARLSPEVRAKLPLIMHEENYAAGEKIYSQDDENPTFNIVLKGRVKTIRVRPDGREITLCSQRPGASSAH